MPAVEIGDFIDADNPHAATPHEAVEVPTEIGPFVDADDTSAPIDEGEPVEIGIFVDAVLNEGVTIDDSDNASPMAIGESKEVYSPDENRVGIEGTPE